MAMSPQNRWQDWPLDAPASRRAAWLSIALCLAAGVGLAVFAILAGDAAADIRAAAGAATAAWLGMAGVGAFLLRRRLWAQRVLLGWWLFAGAATVLGVLGALLSPPEEAWTEPTVALVLLPAVATCVVAVWMLAQAPEQRTRARQTSMLAVSVVAALLLTIAINAAAQTHYGRVSLERRGRYTLSGRTRRVLDSLDEQLRLTLAYTDTDPDRPVGAYASRTLELLEEMHEYNPRIEVEAVRSEQERTELLRRIRQRHLTRAEGHVLFLERFVEASGELEQILHEEAARLDDLPPRSALRGAEIPQAARQLAAHVTRQLEQAAGEVGDERTAPLPDFGPLTENVARQLARSRRQIEQFRQTVRDALAGAAEPAGGVDASVRPDSLLAGAHDTISELLTRARRLPDLPTAPSEQSLRGNVIFAETAGRTDTIPFEAVWPVRAGEKPAEGAAERLFDGNAAVASTILRMIREPFATVHLGYLAPPEQLPADDAPADPLEVFSTLRRRLEQANFVVRPWNMSQPLPEELTSHPATTAPATDSATAPAQRPGILVILPPPPIPPMTDEHAEKIRTAVDAGTPALVLTQAQPGYRVPLDSPVLSYLRDDWGIDVQSRHLVVPAVPDPTTAGQYRIDPQRLLYYPLSNFTDHKIGRSLQARRMLWRALCPVQPMDVLPPGVQIEPVLTVPANQQATWATYRLEQITRQLRQEQSVVRPDFDTGDIAPPFAVAVAAARAEDPTHQAAPARLAVVTGAPSLTDAYLQSPVRRVARDGTTRLAPPPRNNTDLPVNAVYWLSGWEHFIAAGPPTIQPIEMVDDTLHTVLWALVVLGLPLAVVATGTTILLIRAKT